MNRRKFLQWLGIGIPAATVAAVVVKDTADPPKVIEAKLGEWHNYYSEGDPELMEALENWKSRSTPGDPENANLYYDKEFMGTLKRSPDMFEAIASRRVTTISADCKREFFVYA